MCRSGGIGFGTSDRQREGHSAKSNYKQARAQQKKASCRKGEESITPEVMIAHDFTSEVKVRLNLLKID
jgi:hypothetical protein